MNIKKLTALALSGALSLTLLSGCGKKEGTTLKVGATPAPHAEILTVVKDILAKEDITLEIVEFTAPPTTPPRTAPSTPTTSSTSPT